MSQNKKNKTMKYYVEPYWSMILKSLFTFRIHNRIDYYLFILFLALEGKGSTLNALER